jgi:hypothetical protein
LAQFLDGIQATEDVIKEFKLIANGTSSVNIGAQFISSDIIPKPTKLYRNYILMVSNKSGLTMSTVSILGYTIIANNPIPNVPINTTAYLRSNVIPANGASGVISGIDLTSEEPNLFLMGNAKFTFNLNAAATAAGTIDWALIGY